MLGLILFTALVDLLLALGSYWIPLTILAFFLFATSVMWITAA